MKEVLKKLFYKNQSPVLLLEAPPEMEALKQAFDTEVHEKADGGYDFIVGFARSKAQALEVTEQVLECIDGAGIFWLAYPKATSKLHPGADINRDSLHALLGEQGFDGVALVALDDDWSAMRFKLKG